eukprot:TRINITY_DN12088_c0_g1_i2.p2 TRINITY_DN12088_c0_g1~~TRINITY_DN12088_c0_g1_i2.p2  ORF type:complete len:317 (+),score=60.91 TRINITY_DN12088_c0_g1_i2:2270-3220(+)
MPLEDTNDCSEAIALMKQRLSGLETEEGRKKGLAFQPRSDDVFVVTTPKAGTTWMQQICHQLRTRGSMEFDEISQVTPWIELAHDLDQDLNADQVAKPRVFKTHCWYNHVPKGGKYIVVVRNPVDVAYSFFKFFRGWYFQPGEVDLRSFLNEFWLSRGIPDNEMQNASYHHHLLSWYEHRKDSNVLWVFFEDMKQDLEGTVRRVVAFLGLNSNDDVIKTAVHNSSFAFMKEHERQFDEHITKTKRNPHCGLPVDAGMQGSKVQTGRSGAAKEAIPDDVLKAIDAKWSAVAKATGYATYEELRQGLHEELGIQINCK